jgi:integrase
MSKSKPQEYGDGAVFARKDGRWVGVIESGWTERGTRRRIHVYAKTEAAVRRRLRDRKAEIARQLGQTSSAAQARKTVKAWADEWLEIREATKRPNTYTADRGNVRNWIVPAIGTKRLVELTARDVRAVESRIRAAEAKGGRRRPGTSTVLRVQRTLIKMLRDAVEDGYPVQPSIFNVKAPGVPKSDREALETPQAIAVLAHAADLPRGTRWYVAFFAGLRQGEALGLTWGAIDFDSNTITVEWQLQPLPYKVPHDTTSGFRVPHDYEARHLQGRFHLVEVKTKEGARVIPMVPTVRDALLRWREVCPANPHGLLWTRADGWPVDAADDTEEFQALQVAAGAKHPTGRPFHGHEIRNTTATLLNELGVDEVTITAILGHTSIKTSRIYMKGRQAPMIAAMRAVEAAFTQPPALEAPAG